MTTSTSTTPITVDQADTVHAVTKTICRRLLDRADDLKMLPSTRRDLAAVCADAAPRYFNYMTFGEVDARGFERTKVTLRLDFKRIQDRERMTEVASDGARYMVQRLCVYVETSQQSYGVTALREHMDHLTKVAAVAAVIEGQYGGRDLYLLLATAEEARADEERRQRDMLAHFIETETSGMRCGAVRVIKCDVAAKLPGIALGRRDGIEANATKCGAREYDLDIYADSVTVTRKL